MTTPVREFQTHRPSGKPSWPLILLAGAEKVGKSWEAAAFSGSDLLGRTFWIQLGETTAEEYGAVPGADYEIVEHNGSYQDLIAATEWAVTQPTADGKPNAVVIDSVSILWEMLSTEQQQIALRRRKPGSNGEAKVTMDQWNAAKDRWSRFLNVLRRHDGPVVLLARMDVVTLVDEGGQPTKNKDWKIKAEKNLPYDVGVIVSMPVRGEAWLSGIQSTRLLLQPGERRQIDGFSLDRLLREMGLTEQGATVPRQYTAYRPDADEAMADAGPQRPAQRERGRADDEWIVPESAPPSPLVPKADPEQINTIVQGMTAVRGITDRDQMREAISAMVHRPIASARDLTRAEANTVLEQLRTEDHARAKAASATPAPVGTPNNPEMTPARKRAMFALFNERGLSGDDNRAERLALTGRILGREVKSSNDLSDTDAKAVIKALTTGEIPATALAAPEHGGYDAFALLDQMIRDPELAGVAGDVERAIADELTAGRITRSDAELLGERLASAVAA